jgi:hypothetical protein
MDHRAATSAFIKLARVLQGGLIAARAATLDSWGHEPERPSLWAPF